VKYTDPFPILIAEPADPSAAALELLDEIAGEY